MAKRGRKRKNNLYFGPEQEEAVLKFLQCKDEKERNAIYNQWLREPFDKMIESIIRKYSLYRRGESFEDLHAHTLSFLITKADKFEGSKGKKAYSYYGTICKNYLLGLLIRDDKELKQLASYEDLSSEIEERDDMKYEMDDMEFTIEKLIKKLIISITDELDESTSSAVGKKKLTENEIKVGLALIEILEDWERTLDLMNGGAKFNKNSVLETMRRYTNLSTKDIRLAMKRYKDLYALIKIDGLENGIEE